MTGEIGFYFNLDKELFLQNYKQIETHTKTIDMLVTDLFIAYSFEDDHISTAIKFTKTDDILYIIKLINDIKKLCNKQSNASGQFNKIFQKIKSILTTLLLLNNKNDKK
jgi:hypothetical protein